MFAFHVPKPINPSRNIPLLLNTELNATINSLKKQNIQKLVSILPKKILDQNILNSISCRSIPTLKNPTLVPLHKTCGYPIFEHKVYVDLEKYESSIETVIQQFSSRNSISGDELEELQISLLHSTGEQDSSSRESLQLFKLARDIEYLNANSSNTVSGIINRDVVFNPTLGCVYFFPSDWLKDEYLFRQVMQNLLSYIYPQLQSFQTIEVLRQAILKYREFKITAKNKVALCPPFRNRCWTLCREPLNGTMKKKLIVKGEKQIVWDSRYLITSSHENYIIKPLTAVGLKKVLEKLPKDKAATVQKIVNSLPPSTRELLPCIEMHGDITSIPTLGIDLNGKFQAQYIPHLERELLEQLNPH
ncbi:hypothetical protein HDV01_006442 [Terramyces sp. JEL0728]|nr:hypothetical protein HDV01_006442 [Terramyces sp. JEL0728]